MATRRLPIMTHAMRPDNSANVYFEPLDSVNASQPWGRWVVTYANAGTAQNAVQGGFVVPLDYVSNPIIRFYWTANTNANNAVIGINYRTIALGESTNQAGNEGSASAVFANPGTAWLLVSGGLTLTQSHFSVGDEVNFGFYRDPNHASDNMAVNLYVFDIFFEYSDV